jgi:hypothetical protein
MCYVDAGGEDIAYPFQPRLFLYGAQSAKKEKWERRLWGDVASPARMIALKPYGRSAIFLLTLAESTTFWGAVPESVETMFRGGIKGLMEKHLKAYVLEGVRFKDAK